MHFYPPSHHVALQPFCHACRTTISPYEIFRALLSNEDSTALEGWVGPFPFPPLGIQPPGKYIFCRKPGCSVCAKSPEVFTIHNDCLRLFYQRCKALPRLWTKAAWNNPWPRASPSRFPVIDSPIYLGTTSEAAVKLGISHMHKLPLEIVSIIRSFSPTALFWRYVVVADLANHIRLQPPEPEETTKIPLVKIHKWKRSTRIQYASDETELPVMRLCIDSNGIKEIERFTADGCLSDSVEGCCSFIVEEFEDLCAVLAEIKDGYLRLVLPKGHPGFRIWDTACPPALRFCNFYSPHPIVSGRLRTVSLSNITGLTFFCRGERIYGIHGHTSILPSARQEYENIPEKLRKHVVWTYVPMEGIKGLGLLGPSTLVIEINGTILRIGQSTLISRSVEISCGLPSILLFNDPHPGQVISTLGMQSRNQNNISLEKHTVLLQAVPCPLNQGGLYHSAASLSGVQSARVFYDQDAKFCKGILLSYYHGGQQALGQCGINVFREETIQAPGFLFHRPTTSSHDRRLDITFAPISTGVADWIGWVCVEMKGTITLWYDARSVVLLEAKER